MPAIPTIVFPTDVQVNGTMSPNAINYPANSIPAGAYVQPGPGLYPPATKFGQRRNITWSQPNATATTEARVVLVVNGTSGGVIQSLKVGALTAGIGAGKVTFDIKKNGVSIATATVDLTSATAAYVLLNVPLAAGASGLVQGDVISLHATASAGGGTIPVGPFAQIIVDEDPQ